MARLGGRKREEFLKRCTIAYTMITVNNPSHNRTLNIVVLIDQVFIAFVHELHG